MLHHQLFTEDPDVRDAIDAFRGAVLEIRQASAAAFVLPAGDARRAAAQELIDDRIGTMQARCDRIDITLDYLFALINQDLAARPDGASRPEGEHLRALVDENTRAHAAEHQIHRELEKLQGNLRVAVRERLAADRACAGYVAGWAIRGAAR